VITTTNNLVVRLIIRRWVFLCQFFEIVEISDKIVTIEKIEKIEIIEKYVIKRK